jgi:hypothetical protein
MAKAALEPEAEVLETPEIDETEDQVQPETEEQAEEPEQPAEPEESEAEEETIIGFGDEDDEEPSAEDDTPTIRRIRERNREITKQLREKDRELAELRQKVTTPKIEVGPKPGLWDDDIAGDEELYDKRMEDWRRQVSEAEKHQTAEQEKSRRVIESYQRDLETYNSRKASIGVPDYEDAEAVVVAALAPEQQAVALQAANDPAALVYALSKSPAKLAELQKIDNPWKLSAAIARLEGSVKVTTRKKAPNIDRPTRGSASVVQESGDKKLEQLEKEAEKTGDRSKVIAYKRSLREQAK